MSRPSAAPSVGPPAAVDFAALYDAHPEYAARRAADSFESRQLDLEVQGFKLPNLLKVLGHHRVSSLLEIGCATGELLAAFPLRADHAEGLVRRLGLDISAQNIEAARARFPGVEFRAGDFRHLPLEQFDAVLLSDVLEHVPDDTAFLTAAARMAPLVLINLPLECNWLNRRRAYGPNDPSGHLRAYTLEDGFALMARAGLSVLRWERVWIHETPVEAQRRQLRREFTGQAHAGGLLGRSARRSLLALARGIAPLGRVLLASNFFALAQRRLS